MRLTHFLRERAEREKRAFQVGSGDKEEKWFEGEDWCWGHKELLTIGFREE